MTRAAVFAPLRHSFQARVRAWMRRRQGPDALPLTLERRRLYILPTRAGLAFTALLFLMLLAGLNYANSLALFLTFLLSGFALVSMQQCHRNLLGATLIAAHAPPVFAGAAATLHLRLGNRALQPRLQLEAGAPEQPVVLANLPARGEEAAAVAPAAQAARRVAHRACAAGDGAAVGPVPGLDLGARPARTPRLSAARRQPADATRPGQQARVTFPGQLGGGRVAHAAPVSRRRLPTAGGLEGVCA